MMAILCRILRREKTTRPLSNTRGVIFTIRCNANLLIVYLANIIVLRELNRVCNDFCYHWSSGSCWNYCTCDLSKIAS